jgi:20S proteasome subunit alpha 2
MLYQVDPSGSFFAWKATAIGKNMLNAKNFLEKRFNDELEFEDAVHTAILTLKEGFEGELTEHTMEIGVVDASGWDALQPADQQKSLNFRKLSPAEIKDYLVNIA